MRNSKYYLKMLIRYFALFTGFFMIASGIVFAVRAGLGVSPWDVLHVGISNHTGLSLGRVSQVVGLILVTVSYAFKVKPNLGTLLNMYFVGFFIDLVANIGLVPQPVNLFPRIALYLAGVAVAGFGVAIYMSSNLGNGPRDALMVALTRLTSRRVGVIRTFMEVSVATVGYFLGGPLGVGTVLFALFVGWFIELGFFAIGLVKKSIPYKRLLIDVSKQASLEVQ